MRVLTITAHPHYAGCNIAGTLYKHVQRGDDVYAVNLTAGDLMTDRVVTLVTSKGAGIVFPIPFRSIVHLC